MFLVGGARAGLLVALLVGCGGPSAYQCDGSDCAGTVERSWWYESNVDMADVLLVVDPLAAQGDLAAVQAQLAGFAHELALFPGGLDLHVAIVWSIADPTTGDPITASSPTNAARCGVKGAFLSEAPTSCGVTPDFDGPLARALGCLVASTTPTAGPNQSLEVVRRVLGAVPGHQPAELRDFNRAGARHVVVVISPRDDASAQIAGDPAWLAAYADALVATNGGPPAWLGLSFISTPPAAPDGGTDADAGTNPAAPSSCAAGGSTAAGATRLWALANAVSPGESVFLDICSDDWSAALSPALNKLAFLLIACVPPGARDLDPTMPPSRPDCVAHQIAPDDGGTSDLPPCRSGQRPCLDFEKDLTCDSTTRVVIRRDCRPPRGTAIELLCAQAPRD
jgi:hypothetical protein